MGGSDPGIHEVETQVEGERGDDEEQPQKGEHTELAAGDLQAFAPLPPCREAAHQHDEGDDKPCQTEAKEEHAAGGQPFGIEFEGSQRVGAVAHRGQYTAERAEKRGGASACHLF